MLSRYHLERLKRVKVECGHLAMAKLRRQLEDRTRLKAQLLAQGYRYSILRMRPRVTCLYCRRVWLWPISWRIRQEHQAQHETLYQQEVNMRQTKQERATARRASLDAKRLGVLNANGYELIEVEYGMTIQCMSCGQSWQRLGTIQQGYHRMICAPDPKLEQFVEPVPTSLPLPLRLKPW